MTEVVLDTETTGISIREGHRIVEIGCIELENFVPTKKIFHYYLNPERKVSENAFKIHGYSDEFLSDKKKFSEIAEEFLEFIKGKKIIIHNAEFDIGHINNELGLINKNKLKMENVIDTLDIARNKFPGSSLSLDALCKRFRIDNSKRKNHTALIDCDLLSKVYINLLDQREPTLNFADDKTDLVSNYNNKQTKYSKKIVEITKEESVAHSIFLKEKLKKNFF
ncbi:MAG: DNA polymerase III subunit epsilon [Candidatus Pelagibacter sp.]|tara:strand:- start:3192 stop:3860 length:669 start_codon:yes stop_codon:yes gene_type:complete